MRQLNGLQAKQLAERESEGEDFKKRPRVGGLSRDMLVRMSSRPPFTPEPQNGTAKAYSRTALPVNLPQGAASRILLTVAIMSRQRRDRSLG